MKHLSSRIRRAVAVAAMAPVAFGACSSIEDTLLEPQQPGVITPEDVVAAGATGADALRIGALGRLQAWTAGGGNANQENAAMLTDLLTDVWKSSDTFTERNRIDRREIPTNDGVVASAYSTMTRSRGYFRSALDAIRAQAAGVTDANSKMAEMYFALGLTEMSLAEFFCNGIPLGETVAGEVRYTAPLTNQQVYAVALAHLDSAITLSSGTTALATSVRNAASVAKGRTLVNMGQFAQAAAAVASVPTAFQYTLTFSQPTQSNEIWSLNATRSNARYTVGDSLDHTTTHIRNAIPFASLKDPRVPTTGSSTNVAARGIDNATPWVGQLIWTTREAPIVLVSGIDARLVEAEAKLQTSGTDIAGAVAILNTLRTSPRTLGAFQVPAMTALTAPASREAAIDLFFREKALWQYARGTRLGDLRRLVRQYGRTQANVFPSGNFHKENLPFGSDVNLPVTDSEKTNPNFTGCIDRNA